MNTNITVNLTPEIRLEQALKEAGVENPASIISLTITGTMKKKDFSYIKKNMSKTLKELDMGDASVGKKEFPDTSLLNKKNVLTTITLPKSQSFYLNILDNCACIEFIKLHPDDLFCISENGVLFSKDKTILIKYPQGKQGDYIIPDSVTEIDDFAFYKCAGIKKIVIPNSVTVIGDYAFAYCVSLTSIDIPNSVIEIGDKAFSYCEKLSTVTLPDSIKQLRAFQNCYHLTISIPKSITKIDITGVYFDVHSENPAYSSENGVLFNKDKTRLISCPKNKQGEYIIPNSVVKIEDNAFGGFLYGCNLTSVIIPDSVIKIGRYALPVKLSSIFIPKSVIEIGDNMWDFHDTVVTVHPDNPFFTSENGKLKEKN